LKPTAEQQQALFDPFIAASATSRPDLIIQVTERGSVACGRR
jgi:hypothetical protein